MQIPLPRALFLYANADYLVHGVVTGSNGNYSVVLNLETAFSRELVKSASVEYTFSQDLSAVGWSACCSACDLIMTTYLHLKKIKETRENPMPFTLT